MIYFVHYGETGWIKIGVARDVLKRLTGLRVSSPEEITVGAICQGGVAQEAALHRALKASRGRGEWFRSTPLVLFAMRSAKAGSSVAEIITAIERAKRKAKRAQRRSLFRNGAINVLLFKVHSPWWGPETRPVRIRKLRKLGYRRPISPEMVAWADRRYARDAQKAVTA